MRAQIEGNAYALAHFLAAHDYPAYHDPEILQDHALMVRLEDDGCVAGYVWAGWSTALPDVLDFHVCIAPEFRGRWLNEHLWHDLFTLARLFGARMLMTKTIGERERTLVGRLLERKLGFTVASDGTCYKQIEQENTRGSTTLWDRRQVRDG